MARTLNSLTLNAPSGPLNQLVGSTFTFTVTPGFSGTSTVNRYDVKFERSTGSYATIAAAGTGLTTADTNPITNTNTTQAISITVTCAVVGTYTIRASGAPATGGSYTVTSGTQTVTVYTNDSLTSANVATTAPVVGAPTITQNNALTSTNVATSAPVVGAPTASLVYVNTALTSANVSTSAPEVGAPTLAEEGPALRLPTWQASKEWPLWTPRPMYGRTIDVEAGTNDELTAADVATGAPVVGDPTLSSAAVDYSLTSANVATGAPVVGDPALETQAIDYALESSDVATGAPTVDAPELTAYEPIDYPLEATDIAVGAPVIGAPDFVAEVARGLLPAGTNRKKRRKAIFEPPELPIQEPVRVPVKPKAPERVNGETAMVLAFKRAGVDRQAMVDPLAWDDEEEDILLLLAAA